MSSTAAAVVTQQLTSGRSQAAGDVTLTGAKLSGAELSVAALFDEIYKGRRIAGAPGQPVTAQRATSDADSAGTSQTPQVLIDGAALHIMTNADGTYSSVVNHYQSFRSLHEVARAAVDDLGDATLVHLHHHG